MNEEQRRQASVRFNEELRERLAARRGLTIEDLTGRKQSAEQEERDRDDGRQER